MVYAMGFLMQILTKIKPILTCRKNNGKNEVQYTQERGNGYKEYLEAVFNEIKDIPEGAYLSEEQKGLFFLGVIHS